MTSLLQAHKRSAKTNKPHSCFVIKAFLLFSQKNEHNSA